MNKIIHNRLSIAAIIAVVALAISIPAVSFSQGEGDRSKAAVAAKNSKPKGLKGDKGDRGPLALPTGVTLRGVFALGGQAAAAGTLIRQPISFGFTLAAEPVPHYIKFGDVVPAGCTGTPEAPGAASGHLCIFEAGSPNSATGGFSNPVTGVPNTTSTTFGAAVSARSTAAGPFGIRGSWAVTG